MHPTLRQVAPKVPCSQTAIRMSPSLASTPGSGRLFPEPVSMIARSKCSTWLVPSRGRCVASKFRAEVVVEPASQLGVGGGARLSQRQEDVVLGIGDGGDRLPVSHASRPARDLPDVEHGVAALDGLGVGGLRNGVIRADNQVGHPDVEAAVQLRLASANGVDPPEGNGEPTERLQVEVVVELARVVTMQAGAVTAGGGLADHLQLAEPGKGDE